jgi:hypothetical protein
VAVAAVAFALVTAGTVAACRPDQPAVPTGAQGAASPSNQAPGGPSDVPSAEGSPSSSAVAGGPAGSAGSAAPATPAAPAAPAAPARNPAPISGCPVFPADNVWHADVSRLPLHRNSSTFVTNVGQSRPLHPDFGSGLIDGAPFGMPITTVPAGTRPVPVRFLYADESDPGPYLIPRNARIEGGPNATGDRHVIAFDPAGCKVYELYAAHPNADGSWAADSGAIFDLRSNRLRKPGDTSADAAGLSIMAGLVRYDEVAAGHVDHALRITVPKTQSAYIWPARHEASSNSDAGLPPMGLRLRLKASVDTSRMPFQARVVAEALKRYGAIVADNGAAWFFGGTEDSRWDNDQLNALKSLHGSDFEAVDESGLMVDPNSGAARR